MSRRFDNKGFSMVELLVGLLILAVIAVPLLKAFATAANASAKAREFRSQTMAAQNVIEAYKAAGISAVIRGLAGHDDTLGSLATVSRLDILVTAPDGTKSYEEVSPEDYDALPDDAHGYRLYLTDVAGGTKNYDAVLTLDASAFVRHNEAPIVDYKAMDAVYAQPDPDKDPINNPDVIAAKEFASRATIDRGAEVSYAEFLNRLMERTITITIRKLASGQDTGVVSCTATFSYSAAYSYLVAGPDPDDPPALITQHYETEISNDFYSGGYTADETGLDGLYFFYYPNLTETAGDADDVIEIINRDNVPASIYLIRQGGDDPAYRVSVNLRERHTGAMTENARVYSNMICDYRVYMGHPAPGGGYSDYWFNTRTFDGALVDTPAKNRMYGMTVAVYKASSGFAGDPLSVFDASSLE